jgi:acyl-CoA synthetase (NDP forming)
VAMKAQAAALSHKSDAGGVMLNLADAAAVRAAMARWSPAWAPMMPHRAGWRADRGDGRAGWK